MPLYLHGSYEEILKRKLEEVARIVMTYEVGLYSVLLNFMVINELRNKYAVE